MSLSTLSCGSKKRRTFSPGFSFLNALEECISVFVNKDRGMYHKQPCARDPFMLKKGSLWKPNGHRGTQILSQHRSFAKFSFLSMNTDDWGFIK